MSAAPCAGDLGLPWLVADIGGTNARFGLVLALEAGVTLVRQSPAAATEGPAQAVADYLASLPQGTPAPRRAAMAVATAVDGDLIELTNSPWRFSRQGLQRALGLDLLLVLNDFEALALSLPRLRPSQFRAHAAAPDPRGTLAVVGPGTGLGVGAVVPTRCGWVALPGEGGHVTLSAADEFESALLARVRQRYPHVSAERLLSGIGLPVLHEAVRAVSGAAPVSLDSAAIVARGLAGDDAACRQTIDSFCALLGSLCGNVALTLGARGGVYIGGGIVPRLGERFFASSFRQRFESKGRFQPYLASIPTALITDTLAALAGAALAIEQHQA